MLKSEASGALVNRIVGTDDMGNIKARDLDKVLAALKKVMK